jgi:hypothetical protein
MSRHPTHGAKASSSRAVLPTLDGTVACLEQGREHVSVLPAHFSEAQVKQTLWQEFCDHDALLNIVLNEALQIHGGPAWRIFQVCVSYVGFWSFSPSCLSHVRAFPDSVPLAPCPLVTGVGGSSPGEVRPPRPAKLRA